MPTDALAHPRPLVVRLRNWIGDVVLGVPSLRLLAEHGYRLELVGKPWAAALLEGEGWRVHALPADRRSRIALYRTLRADARRVDPGFDRRLNALLLPLSFSSALEARLAGLQAIGYAHEARAWLLARSIRRNLRLHELQREWRLACAVLGQEAAPPEHAALRVAPQATQRAAAIMAQHGLASGFVVLCPFAGGTFEKLDKRWPDFPSFAQAAAGALGRRLVVCPGPSEVTAAREHYAQALVLEGVALGDYAALMQASALVVANDCGPGHVAAAVGARLVSVLGPTDASIWGARGPRVAIVQRPGGWPSVADVLHACEQALRSSHDG